MAKLARALAAAAGNAASLTIEYIASRSNVSDSRFVVWPNGTQVGDLVISFAGTIGRQYNPAGWTGCFFYDGTFEINCRYKIMTATDISAGSVQLASVDHTWSALQLHTFRPSAALSNVYVNDSQASTSYIGTSITITPTEQSPPHIILGGNLYYNANTPDMSGTYWDGKINSVGYNTLIRIQFAYEIQEDYSTSRTFAQTGTGNPGHDELGGCYLSIE